MIYVKSERSKITHAVRNVLLSSDKRRVKINTYCGHPLDFAVIDFYCGSRETMLEHINNTSQEVCFCKGCQKDVLVSIDITIIGWDLEKAKRKPKLNIITHWLRDYDRRRKAGLI